MFLDHAMRRFVDVHDSIDSPPTVSLCTIPTTRGGVNTGVVNKGGITTSSQPSPPPPPPPRPIFAHAEKDPRTLRLNLQPPELVRVLSADRLTVLHGAVYKPDPGVHGPGPYPTLVSVYGGPHVQVVQNSWHLTAGWCEPSLCNPWPARRTVSNT